MKGNKRFNIWGKKFLNKKECYETYQNIKRNWPIGYILNEQETKYMKEMMDIGYQSPIKPDMIQNVWKKNRDNIIEISVEKGPIFKEKTIWFWVKKRSEIIKGDEFFDFSVARCICFPGQTGFTHESDYPKTAVHRAMVNAIAPFKIQWKKNQGYMSGKSPLMHAHHIDGKELKTIKQKFLNELKITEEQWINKIYPLHGDFTTAKIEYTTIVGWNFKSDIKSYLLKEIWIEFHEKNKEYELIDPIIHKQITSSEIKFNTNLRNRYHEME